ncbi:MAG: hypothetical protein WCT05_11270 [Lentisphaeria bacterium]
MQMPLEFSLKLSLLKEKVQQKAAALRKGHHVELGCTSAPATPGYVEDDKLIGPTNTDWSAWLEPEKGEYDRLLLQILSGAPGRDPKNLAKLDGDKLWVWGGQTPYWGGSMADDTLIRGADYFSANNVVYVYGPTNEKMLALHSKYKRMLCQINKNCRTPGALEGGSEEDNAERLSKLSLQFPNIVGAMCDDVTAGSCDVVAPEAFEKRYVALKKHNPKLKMVGVIYGHELYKDFSRILPYLDVVNLWLWDKDHILQYDEFVTLCQQKFPGKPIISGVFLHEYGVTDAGNSPELLAYQLDRAREYITRNIVEGVILLGDREIKKWPTVAESVRQYLRNQG